MLPCLWHRDQIRMSVSYHATLTGVVPVDRNVAASIIICLTVLIFNAQIERLVSCPEYVTVGLGPIRDGQH